MTYYLTADSINRIPMAKIHEKQAIKSEVRKEAVRTRDHPKISNRRQTGPASGAGRPTRQLRTKVRAQTHLFDATLQKTNEMLKEIADHFDWADRHKAYQALRSVLHTLRDRLPADQAVAFGAQLPMLVRGFYYEGWKPSSTPIKMIKEEFLGEVEEAVNQPFEQPTEDIVKMVCAIVDKHISPGEMKKLKKTLPKDIVGIME